MSDVRRVPEKINKYLGSGGVEESIPFIYSGILFKHDKGYLRTIWRFGVIHFDSCFFYFSMHS